MGPNPAVHGSFQREDSSSAAKGANFRSIHGMTFANSLFWSASPVKGKQAYPGPKNNKVGLPFKTGI